MDNSAADSPGFRSTENHSSFKYGFSAKRSIDDCSEDFDIFSKKFKEFSINTHFTVIQLKTASAVDIDLAKNISFCEFKSELEKITGVSPQNQLLIAFPRLVLTNELFSDLMNESLHSESDFAVPECTKKKFWLVERQTKQATCAANRLFFIKTWRDACRFLMSDCEASETPHIATIINIVSNEPFLRDFQEVLLCSKMQLSSLSRTKKQVNMVGFEPSFCTFCSKKVPHFNVKCPLCKNTFCCRHRLPEMHRCTSTSTV